MKKIPFFFLFSPLPALYLCSIQPKEPGTKEKGSNWHSKPLFLDTFTLSFASNYQGFFQTSFWLAGEFNWYVGFSEGKGPQCGGEGRDSISLSHNRRPLIHLYLDVWKGPFTAAKKEGRESKGWILSEKKERHYHLTCFLDDLNLGKILPLMSKYRNWPICM